MPTTPVQSLTSIGNIADGDKIVGERVAGTTGTVTINGILYDADFATDGVMVRTASTVYANRTNTGTADRITITDGNGVSGNPTYDIASTYVGQNTITTLGTITTGAWNGTIVTTPYGGTGRDTALAYTPIIGGTTDAGIHQSMATAGSTGQIMQSGGAAAVPTWSTATYPATAGTSGKLLQSDGTNIVSSSSTWPESPSTLNKRVKSDGTNFVMSTTTLPDSGTTGKLIRGDGTNYAETTSTFADTYTASNLLYSNGSNTVTGLATANSGVLVTDGSGVPSIATDIPTAVTVGGQYNYRVAGTDVIVADGGTGVSSLTAYAVICGGTTSTGAVQSIASVGTAGQVLTSNGAGALPTMQAASSGTEVTQAEQEAATNTTSYVSAAKQQFHPSAAKVWANFGVTGNILASYNVSSVTDVGAGQATVNYTTAFSSTSYSALVHTEASAGTLPLSCAINGGKSTGTLSCYSTNQTNGAAFTTTAADPGTWSVMCFGDQ